MDRIFQQALGREVLSEAGRRQRPSRQFSLPVVVVSKRIAVNRLVLSSVDRKVGLTVTVQIELAQPHAAFHWLFEDPRSSILPCHVTSRGSPTFTEASFISASLS